MKKTFIILMGITLCAATVFGQGTVLWNESVNGPLSDSGSHPTLMGSLAIGTNTVLGATGIEPTGNSWLLHEDVFTFVVPNNTSLSAVYISVDKPKVGAWIGDPGFTVRLGYSGNSANGDLLAQWGIALIDPGAYGMNLGNYDLQPFTSFANYRLDFVVIPEPTSTCLLLLTIPFFGICRWREPR